MENPLENINALAKVDQVFRGGVLPINRDHGGTRWGSRLCSFRFLGTHGGTRPDASGLVWVFVPIPRNSRVGHSSRVRKTAIPSIGRALPRFRFIGRALPRVLRIGTSTSVNPEHRDEHYRERSEHKLPQSNNISYLCGLRKGDE